MLRYLLVIVFFLLSTFNFQLLTPVHAADDVPGAVVIINQVRGEECCGAGRLDSLKTQLETTVRLQLPATYVIRYDALKDEAYTKVLSQYNQDYPDLIELGVMVEIVPSLAADAGVSYRGTQDTWYQAHHAFTIGYPIDARGQLIDTLMRQYVKVFGKNPQVSSAWMIDTDSLHYLQSTYGIGYHQITREQWGTDSYTLAGGPPHYPYPAAAKWLMMPDYEVKNPVWIIRQTITDPLYNYGDMTSSYTSQPNDYARGKRDLDYFKTLLENALKNQPNGQLGFGCIGLENSMDTPYQDEYIRQLEYIAKQHYPVIPATQVSQLYTQATSIYQRSEGEKHAWWITSPTYRMRIIQNGDAMRITDLRVYSREIEDPYSTYVAKHEGYWVAPYLLDGSRWHEQVDFANRSFEHVFTPIANDFQVKTSALILPVADTATQTSSTRVNPKSLLLQYHSLKGREVLIAFGSDDIQIVGFYPNERKLPYEGYTPSQFPVSENRETLSWTWKDKTTYKMNFNCEARRCNLTFDTKQIPDFNSMRFEHYPYTFPEAVDRSLSQAYSKVTVNNRYALAGRNPIRLILEPHDQYRFPILLTDEAQITTDPKNIEVRRLGELRKSTHQYVDLHSQDPTRADIQVAMRSGGTAYTQGMTVYFAPPCAKEVLYCLTHPVDALRYLITKAADWWYGRS